MNRNIMRLGTGIAVAAALSQAPIATAATKNWNVLSGSWNTAGNWSPAGVPTAGDDAQIMPADGADRTITYNYTGAAVVGRLSRSRRAYLGEQRRAVRQRD
jgi:hypothetical protein